MKRRIIPLSAVLVMAPIGALAQAGSAVRLVVVREHGVGTAAQAQNHLDRLVAAAASVNGWSSAEGKYHTTRDAALQTIASDKPQFGIMSLAPYLALRKQHGLDVLGKAEVTGAGGRRYHILSANAPDLGACKGKRLASDHVDDTKFIDRVVAGGEFKLSDFQLVETRRPLQTVKKLIDGEADCALVDDAQVADLKNVQGSATLKTVWKSEQLPPMVVVGFPNASSAQKKSFRQNLSKVCTGPGKDSCAQVGIRALEPTTEASYAKVVKAYGD